MSCARVVRPRQSTGSRWAKPGIVAPNITRIDPTVTPAWLRRALPRCSEWPLNRQPLNRNRKRRPHCRADEPLIFGLVQKRGSALGSGLVQAHGGPNERLQRLFIYLLALVEVDGTSRVSLETGVEEPRRILKL